MKIHLTWGALLWSVLAASAHAALALDRTRIIFPQQSALETVRVKNPAEQPYLSQAWISDEQGNELLEPFMVVPPLVRINSDDYAVLRIEKVSGLDELPSDRESVFYFHVREVPPKEMASSAQSRVGQTGGSIQFAIESVIKLFYRPAALSQIKNIDLAQAKATSIEMVQEEIWLENNSPFYATYFSITDNQSNPVKGFESIMLKPFSREKLTMAVKGEYFITHINDYGALITNRYQCGNQRCQFIDRVK